MLKLPLILAAFLYILIYFIRLNQGGFEIKNEWFKREREVLDLKISQFLPEEHAQLLSGILLGNKKDLPGNLKLALRDTSTLHIVVVSGQNLTMVAGLFLSLSGLIKKRPAIILSFAAVVFYTLLTGAQIPVIRAAIMATLTFSAQFFGRQKDAVWILIVSAGLMLLINPLWISDLSFQLSFLATVGVVLVSPILSIFLASFPSILRQDLAITIGAQIMVIPIIAANFHQLSLVGIFANLMIGWTVPFIMILGSLLLFFSFVSSILTQVFATLLQIFLSYFIYIVKFFASLPFAWEYVGDLGWIFWIGYYFLLIGILLGLSKNK